LPLMATVSPSLISPAASAAFTNRVVRMSALS
jgi:hypothetical protein